MPFNWLAMVEASPRSALLPCGTGRSSGRDTRQALFVIQRPGVTRHHATHQASQVLVGDQVLVVRPMNVCLQPHQVHQVDGFPGQLSFDMFSTPRVPSEKE